MPFKIKFADITKYEGDAIVNSLGVDGRVKGLLCKAILNAADSKELTSIINSKTKNKVGDIFVTKGYNLCAYNIIHVVSPFKEKDDKNNTNLKKIYESIINKAIELNYKSIALPFLGTGANGYLDSDAYDAVSSVCADLVAKEEQLDKDILSVTLIVRGNQKMMEYQKMKDRYNENYSHRDDIPEIYYFEKQESPIMINDCCGMTFEKKSNPEGNKLKRNAIKCAAVYNNLDPNKFFAPKMLPYVHDYDFVDDYVYQKNINDKVLAKDGLDRKVKYKMRKGKKLFNIDIFRIATSLKMEREEIIQFMLHCHQNFDPTDPLDVFFAEYLCGKYPKQKNLVFLAQLSMEKCGVSLTY